MTITLIRRDNYVQYSDNKMCVISATTRRSGELVSRVRTRENMDPCLIITMLPSFVPVYR